MIICNNNEDFKNQIDKNIIELEKYKNTYNNKLELYNIYSSSLNVFKNGQLKESFIKEDVIKNKNYIFTAQIKKIDYSLKILEELKNESNISEKKKKITQYNKKYKQIKANYIDNTIDEDKTTLLYINLLMNDFKETLNSVKKESAKEVFESKIETKTESENENKNENLNITKSITVNDPLSKIKEKNRKKIEEINNNTLLISEKLNKVVLPYTYNEIQEILQDNSNDYTSINEVIENVFIRPISDYKSQFSSRYRETIKLARDKENFGLADSISLAIEMMGKRNLHPAIISACKSLDDLKFYLDCLEKNELENFKAFNIKYELYPMVIKNKSGAHAKETKSFFKLGKIRGLFNRHIQIGE